MEQTRLRELEDQCIQDCQPPCMAACPVHVDIRGMLKAVSIGDYTGGLSVLRKTVPFPGIISRICKQPCQTNCFRNTIGGSIQVAALERACVDYGEIIPSRELLLPRKNLGVAIVGGGLSGLTAALELYRKGFDIQLYERSTRLGGQVWNLSSDPTLPKVIFDETKMLELPGITIHLNTTMSTPAQVITENNAVLLACGSSDFDFSGLEKDSDGRINFHAATFQTSNAQVFVGGSLIHEPDPILSISDGRRAAISIDRFMQRVSLTAARTDEGSSSTRLFTNIKKIQPTEPVWTKDEYGHFSQSEAEQEAQRCIQCECMECVKVCEYLKQYKSYPRKYVREIYNNLTIIKRTRSANQFINSCTQCGLCKEVCPTDVDMGQVTLDARKSMVAKNKMPISAHDFALRDMAFSNSDQFASDFVQHSEKSCQVAFFPGCQLAASNPEYILKIVRDLKQGFPDLGVMLGCCGAPAEWSGEEGLFNDAAMMFLQRWQEMGEPDLILACSSCERILKKSIPSNKLIPIWEAFREKRLLHPRQDTPQKEFVIHDPCTSRHHEIWQDGARATLTQLGISFHELEMSRNMTECCGYGGVAWLANPPLVKDMISRRVGEDSSDYIAYCVMCRDLFTGVGKNTLHLLDLLYATDLEKTARRKGPDYSQRHENRIRVRQAMEKEFNGKEHFAVESYEAYPVLLSVEMREKVESRLILIEDIQRVIEHAETTGEKFINKTSGHSLAFYKPNIITYWVNYCKVGGEYEIFDAYSHRMEVDGKGEV